MIKSELCKKILCNNGGNVELYTAEEQKTIEHFIRLGWIKICFNADNSKSYKITYSGKDQIRFDSQMEDLEKVMDTINTLLYES